MLSLKKSLFAFCFGLGVTAALSSPALAFTCEWCGMLQEQCLDGDQAACHTYNKYSCWTCQF